MSIICDYSRIFSLSTTGRSKREEDLIFAHTEFFNVFFHIHQDTGRDIYQFFTKTLSFQTRNTSNDKEIYIEIKSRVRTLMALINNNVVIYTTLYTW